jgi:flavin-dependent dehydrogenase
VKPVFDLCVLGGGPAGSAFSILMARRGATVALVEKSAFDSSRAGEHLPPRARGALRALGGDAEVFRSSVSESPGILTRWSTGVPVFKPYVGHPEGLGLNLARHRFDAALFDLARRSGVTTYEETSLAEAQRLNGGWDIYLRSRTPACESLGAARVVDATGRASVFARRQAVGWQSFGDMVAAVGRLTPAPGCAADDSRCLFVEASKEGWWSVTPMADEIVATFYASAAAKRHTGLDEYQWWQRGLDASPGTGGRLDRIAATLRHVQMYPAFPRVLQKMFGPDWFAIGDAAATHDPLSGHGMLYAFESAFRAAEMAGADMSLEISGAIYQEAMVSRFERHLLNRDVAYSEAAPCFEGAEFWREMASSVQA